MANYLSNAKKFQDWLATKCSSEYRERIYQIMYGYIGNMSAEQWDKLESNHKFYETQKKVTQGKKKKLTSRKAN